MNKFYFSNQGGAVASLIRKDREYLAFFNSQEVYATTSIPENYSEGDSSDSVYILKNKYKIDSFGYDKNGSYLICDAPIKKYRVSVTANTLHPTEYRKLNYEEILHDNLRIIIKYVYLEIL